MKFNGMKFVRGIAALFVLVVGVIGIPYALVVLGGNPLPSELRPAAVLAALLRPDDGSILIGMITIVGWIAWLIFTLSVVLELVAALSRQRFRPRLPGLGGAQRMVASLIIMVVAMIGFAQTPRVHADPSPTATPVATQPATPLVEPDRTPPVGTAKTPPRNESSGERTSRDTKAANSIIHQVERGDDLWSLAERYYGQGRDWRKIATANPAVLTGGPDRLEPGWRLSVPDPRPQQADDKDRPGTEGAEMITVERGDTLSSIAQAELGDESSWRDIFDANRAQLSDPDAIDVGVELQLPAGDTKAEQKPDRDQPKQGSAQQKSGEQESGEQESSEQEPGEQETERPADSGTSTDTGTPAEPQPIPSQPTAAAPTTEAPATTSPEATTPATEVPQTEAPQTEAPQTEVPRTEAPGTEAPATAGPVPQDTRPAESTSGPGISAAEAAPIALGSVGGLLAAGLLGGLAVRRQLQLHARPVGRRILHAAPPVQEVEAALGQRQRPLSLQTLDLALRAIAATNFQQNRELPDLAAVRVSDDLIELIMAGEAREAPVGFRASGSSWLLNATDAQYLESVPGLDDAARPFPSLVSLGEDDQGRQVMINLEAAGILALQADDHELTVASLSAMAVELSFSRWADEMSLTLIGGGASLPDALGKHNVIHAEDLDPVLDRLAERAAAQREHRQGASVAQQRTDPDLADAWVPEILLIDKELSHDQTERLATIMLSEPRPAMAAIVVGEHPAAPWRLELGDGEAATLRPFDWGLSPQLLTADVTGSVLNLVAVTGSEETTPAPWWNHDLPVTEPEAKGKIVRLGSRIPSQGADMSPALGEGAAMGGSASEESARVSQLITDGGVIHHPILMLLGPIDLVGAPGTPPQRATKQCIEYLAWLLEHPGSTAHAMANALAVAEGTRRSNMSRLRAWLGSSEAGDPYLPDAYTGRIAVDTSVSTDWQRLQLMIAGGINAAATETLSVALDLVRGAPLADAAPGQWHWAEELRTDMASVIRDLGVELATRALADNKIDLARWAAARSLTAAPEDELLMRVRIQTEHQAGNTAEVERLALQLAAHARALGVDLDPATVSLLQQVMEGRIRARLA